MRPPWLLLVVLLAMGSLAGCLADEQGPFTVVEVHTSIEGEGPPVGHAACSIPPPTAAIDPANRTIEVAEKAWDDTDPFDVLLVDRRSVDDPASEASCPPFRNLVPSPENRTWRFTMRGYEHSLSLRADGETVHVHGVRLGPGEALSVNVSFQWTNPSTGDRYNYSGTIEVMSRGQWPSEAIEVVRGYDTLDEARHGGFEAARWQGR